MADVKTKKKLGRPTAEEKSSQLAEATGRKAQLKERKCLHCKKDFLSEGNHNRICDPCRKLLSRLG